MISLLLMALTAPPPPLPRPIMSRTVLCAMSAADGTQSDIRIVLTAGGQLVNGSEQPNYRWQISGDDERYPAPQSERETYSIEHVRLDLSTTTVTRDGMNYNYMLHYDGESRRQPSTRGHLLIERWETGNNSIVEAVGIGLCEITEGGVAQ